MVLLALGLVAVVVVLNMAFGWKGTRSDWEFVAAMGCPAALALVLAVLIWKQRIWAMMLALAMGVILRALFGNETLFLNIMLTGGTVAAAVITGLHLWRAGSPGPS